MKLLVTGGAGFIGSHFIKHMLHTYPEYQITNYDVLTYAGSLANLTAIEGYPNYSFVKGDITDRAKLEELFSREAFDVVVNVAAESHVDRSIYQPDTFAQTNILGTQVLLDVSQKYHVHTYIQVSTDEVYGSLGDTGLFDEASPLQPNSPYSASKASADLLVRAYYRTYDMPVNITRCSNNYGPYQFPEKLIPLMINNIRERQPIPIYGDGHHVRDWIYVEDHCRALDAVLHEGVPGEVYNIGANQEISNLAMAEKVLTLMDAPRSLLHFVSDRQGHDERYALDATKIRETLGWQPSYNLASGLRERSVGIVSIMTGCTM